MDEYSTIFSSNQAVKPKACGCFVTASSSSGCGGWGTTRAEPLKPLRVEAAETGRLPKVRLRGLPMDSRCPRPLRLDVLLPPAIVRRCPGVGAAACVCRCLALCGCPLALARS